MLAVVDIEHTAQGRTHFGCRTWRLEAYCQNYAADVVHDTGGRRPYSLYSYAKKYIRGHNYHFLLVMHHYHHHQIDWKRRHMRSWDAPGDGPICLLMGAESDWDRGVGTLRCRRKLQKMVVEGEEDRISICTHYDLKCDDGLLAIEIAIAIGNTMCDLFLHGDVGGEATEHARLVIIFVTQLGSSL